MTHSKTEEMPMKRMIVLLMSLISLCLFTGCGPKGDTPTDKRQLVQTMKQETLDGSVHLSPGCQTVGGQFDWLCRLQ